MHWRPYCKDRRLDVGEGRKWRAFPSTLLRNYQISKPQRNEWAGGGRAEFLLEAKQLWRGRCRQQTDSRGWCQGSSSSSSSG